MLIFQIISMISSSKLTVCTCKFKVYSCKNIHMNMPYLEHWSHVITMFCKGVVVERFSRWLPSPPSLKSVIIFYVQPIEKPIYLSHFILRLIRFFHLSFILSVHIFMTAGWGSNILWYWRLIPG